ncbi:hypothetical protein QZH41_008174 [Actinostola sp. cb2023]|nr:hypothetical protein QZH41_008174 [Actinostola sp. cb2023]
MVLWKHHRVRIDMTKVDHFIEFVDRPYFYQDVSYGSKLLKLDSGETIEMPNVVRTVTRSTMISQYVQFCQEEHLEPLSRSTLFKILEVRKASQRKSLQGLDNTAADGSAGFNTVESIVDDLEKEGLNRQWCAEVKGRLKDAKRYLKTDYRVHCKPEVAACPDHCRKFALSDERDPDFLESCSHQHSETCDECQNLRDVLEEVEDRIRGSSWHPYSNEQQEDILYDLKQARSDILQWNAHIIRSVNQEAAKQDQLKMLAQHSNSALIIMDWAMKFLQLKYREKQSEWYGKRGLSWHISTVISSDPDKTGNLELQSYAHLFNLCQQDWFAVCSVIENILEVIKSQKPHVKQVFLRSDEAGCYHNSSLIAAIQDVAKRVGINILRYDYSEPQYGKDVCDRILCPMKSCIRRYCNEGHDVNTAEDMQTALSERPVKGTSACVFIVDEAKKTLDINKIEGFSKLNNIQFQNNGVRVWRAYGVEHKLRVHSSSYLGNWKEGKAAFRQAFGQLGNDAYLNGPEPAPERCLLGVYHSAAPESAKLRISSSFTGSGKARVAIASTSLSMGVDFPHVKNVVHFGPGRTLTDHLQQAGRAGRDSQLAHNIILYQGKHLRQCEPHVKDVIRKKDCIIKLLLCHFTEDESFIVPVLHDCCNRCNMSCKCEGDHCPKEFTFEKVEEGQDVSSTCEALYLINSLINRSIKYLLRMEGNNYTCDEKCTISTADMLTCTKGKYTKKFRHQWISTRSSVFDDTTGVYWLIYQENVACFVYYSANMEL